MISAIFSTASFCEPSDFSISLAIFSRVFFWVAEGSSLRSSWIRWRIASSVSTDFPREESLRRSSDFVISPWISLSIWTAFSGVRSSCSALGAGLSGTGPAGTKVPIQHVMTSLLLVRQPLHVLLEELLVFRGEVVDGPLPAQHRLPQPGGQVAPAAGPVAPGAELVDRLSVPVRVVRPFRRIRRM